MPAANVWGAPEPLSELTLWADWDWFSSMVASLRLHAFEHGTVPVWNFMFCGGQPELAEPQSWAWTWPSLFAYLLPPNHALLALWLVLTLVGFAATRALLLRWSRSRLGATVGALVFVFSGCFAARFNAGHASYAFYHGVPLLILCFERAVECAPGDARSARRAAALGAASFCFASGALPHALLHFYPAFVLFALLRTGALVRERGIAAATRAVRAPFAAHALGIAVAAYKLWSVIRWQLDQPRVGVFNESYSVREVLENTLVLMPDYFTRGPLRPHFQLPSWGYNAFVGPLPWLLAIATLVAVVALGARSFRAQERTQSRLTPPDPLIAGFAAALIALGISLSLGNANPYGLASVFDRFPLLDGVRGFNRYQALIVFGIAIAAAQSFPLVAAAIGTPRVARPLVLVLAAGCAAPVLLQSALLVWNIRAEPHRAVLARYGIADATRGAPTAPPVQIVPTRFRLREGGHQTALLEAGFWIAQCYSSLTQADGGPNGLAKARIPLSRPAPARAALVGRDRLVLGYPEGVAGDVTLELRIPDQAQLNVPFRRDPRTRRVVFRAEDLVDGELQLTARYAGPGTGAWISLVALAVAGVWALLWWRAARQRGNTTIVSRTS